MLQTNINPYLHPLQLQAGGCFSFGAIRLLLSIEKYHQLLDTLLPCLLCWRCCQSCNYAGNTRDFARHGLRNFKTYRQQDTLDNCQSSYWCAHVDQLQEVSLGTSSLSGRRATRYGHSHLHGGLLLHKPSEEGHVVPATAFLLHHAPPLRTPKASGGFRASQCRGTVII